VGRANGLRHRKLRTASLLVERGATLVATNADAAYPAPDGLWPGAGALLAVVTTTTGATATVVGKPAAPMFEESARIAGAKRPLMVGDRLDTDIRGAAALGWDSVLTLTGAAAPRDLTAGGILPTYVATDLSLLTRDVPPGAFVAVDPSGADEVARLLESSGLSAEGLSGRIEGATFVCSWETDGVDLVAATFALEPADPGAILRSVAVRAELRGSGLGMLATATAVQLAREQGREHVALFTEGAADFFERLGFRRVSRDALPLAVRQSGHARGCASSATAMILDLRTAPPAHVSGGPPPQPGKASGGGGGGG
jgi:N-acetylglutamate synthase-like GNAT family acetyltransferase